VNRILISMLLTLIAGCASAQPNAVATTDEKDRVEADATAAADRFCLRETGSHLHAIVRDQNERAVQCANAPGRAYTREDLERTGSSTTADALRHLDPSIH
jgi:hypothetical protein